MSNNIKTQNSDIFNIDKNIWIEKIKPYYLDKRGVLDIQQALKDFNIPEEKSKKIFDYIKKKRKEKGKKIISTFGEIYSSYILEKEKGIYLLSLRWPEHLFEIETGADLVGIDIEKFDIAYAEVKASEKDVYFLINKQKKGLAKDLFDNRLSNKFNDQIKDFATKIWVKDEVKRLVKKGKIAGISPENVEKIIDKKDKFQRYGALVRSASITNIDFAEEQKLIDEHCKSYNRCNDECNSFCKKRNPICFLDIVVKEIIERVDDLLILELEVVSKIDLNRED